MRQFDLVILGGGSGAFAAAIKARELDQSVALIERDRLGGTCVNRGCVPSKNLLKAGEDFYYHRGAHFPGIRHGEGRFNFEEVMAQAPNRPERAEGQVCRCDLPSRHHLHSWNGAICVRSRN
ncbi:MAG: FAD-dependent oxidoreductase (plasmid) [Candidatus Manganitrophus sp.]|nr:MAG: FAD-dependent oxidoreductase [Candidatus Manganitrophus sp.]